MELPIKKQFILSSITEYLLNYSEYTILCLPPHSGSFAKVRKNHIHEGIDIYCNNNDSVYVIDSGIIVGIYPFTGEIANSPWWHNTYCICIQSDNFMLNYGEITPNANLKVGDHVKTGQEIGKVKTVLKKDKGLPMSMLHLEMYTKETVKPITEWALNTTQPLQLLNPTQLLFNIL